MKFEQKVIYVIRIIPRGKVATYGQIAAMAGSPRAALIVGRILRSSSGNEQLPWQRVINSKGRISITNIEYPAELQAGLLRKEGVEVTKHLESFFVDLAKFLWAI